MSKVSNFKDAWKTPAKPAGATTNTLISQRVVPPNGPEGLLKQAATSAIPARDKGGKRVVNLKSSLCEPSSIADRMAVENDPDYEDLKESIRQDGQKVPILVRPKLEQLDRYEIAYGRRRWRACRELGIGVLAIIDEDLNDEALVIAQGKENHERKSLSFIETALFVKRLSKEFPNQTVAKAIGVKSVAAVSHYRKVADAIPEDLIIKIGPAPKIGRPKWISLSEHFVRFSSNQTKGLARLTGSEKWKTSSSDERFNIVFSYAKSGEKRAADSSSNTVLDKDGKPVLLLKESKSGVKFAFQGKRGAEFSSFLAEQIPALLAKFEEQDDEQ